MPIAQGTAKQFRFKRQTAKGTISGTTAGQILRRTQGQLSLQKETYNTADEITSTQQMKSSRHGPKQVSGNLNGLVSPGTYADFFQALLRKDAVATTAIASLSITVAGSGPYTLTRGTGSWLTDGIKIGDVVRLTAGTFNAANLNKNLLVTALTATVLTCVVLNGSTLTAEGPIASATLTVPGKKTMAPDTGHTNIYYTIEEWMPDVPRSVVSSDVKVGQAQVEFPGTGNISTSFSLVGLEQTASESVYFTSPTAETTSNVLSSASGLLLVGGTAVATVTTASLTINGNAQVAEGVVGSNLRPDVFRGKVMATGTFSAYFDGGTLSDAFLNETETSLVLVNTDGTAANAGFVTFVMQKVKINSEDRDDGETGIIGQYTFEAIYKGDGGSGTAYDLTTLAMQDSSL